MWRPYSPIVSDLPCHWVLSMFRRRRGTTGRDAFSRYKSRSADLAVNPRLELRLIVWKALRRSLRPLKVEALTQLHRPLRTSCSSRCRLQSTASVCVCVCVVKDLLVACSLQKKFQIITVKELFKCLQFTSIIVENIWDRFLEHTVELLTDYFSGWGSANSPPCLCVQKIAFE